MHINRSARQFALQFLYQFNFEKSRININEKIEEFKELIPASDIPSPMAYPFAIEIINGVIANEAPIKEKLKEFSLSKDTSRIPSIDYTILQIALFELLYCKKNSKEVIIDEAIEIAKVFSNKNASNFINGILDNIAKQIIS